MELVSTALQLLLVVLSYITVAVPAFQSPGEGTPKYFGVTKDVSLEVTPGIVYDGFTKDLTLTCRFSRQQQSDFGTVLALILSRGNPGSNHYSELATFTSIGSDQLEVKDSLGAEVTGVLDSNTESYIAYKWAWPEQDVGGRYYCEAHGWDSKGHPRISSASADVIIKQTLDEGVIPKQMQDLEARLENCRSASIDMAAMLRDAVFEPGTRLRGHTYFLSKPMLVHAEAAQHLCVLLGGYLTEINDKDELAFVINLTDQFGSPSYAGSWDEGHEGNWTFLRSEEPMASPGWNPSIHIDGREKENCLVINWNRGKKMDDICCKCGVHARFICEIP